MIFTLKERRATPRVCVSCENDLIVVSPSLCPLVQRVIVKPTMLVDISVPRNIDDQGANRIQVNRDPPPPYPLPPLPSPIPCPPPLSTSLLSCRQNAGASLPLPARLAAATLQLAVSHSLFHTHAHSHMLEEQK